MMNPETIAALFATNNVYITLTGDTAAGQHVDPLRWHCHIMEQAATGLLVHVYKPLQKRVSL
jgi:hypothetical protein